MKYHPNPYSAATQFRGVTDWYQEPRISWLHTPLCPVHLEGVDIGISGGPDGPPRDARYYKPRWYLALQLCHLLIMCSGLESPPFTRHCPSWFIQSYPLEDEVLPAKEQPLPVAALPTADAPGYVPGLDPKEDLEEDDDEDPKEDPANYPVDRET
ncbi:hypothetical protein Tco_0180362 [Tanacetum coccineum]